MTSLTTAEAPQTQTPAAVQAQVAGARKSDSDGDISFCDLLGVINPLQHIPVISTIYRELTGDTISPAARIAGDALYGGLIGLGSSIVNEVVESTTGNDIGGHIWATLFGDDDDAKTSEVADATPAGNPVASAPPAAAPPGVTAAAVTGPVTPLNGPTSFYQSLQTGAHHFKGVPLNATVPTGDSHHDLPVSGSQALLQAQQPGGALATQAAQSSALGTTGLGASISTPPPSLPGAPPTTNAAAAPAVQGNIADKMMIGLDAYKAMALQQDKTNPPSGGKADGSLTTTALIN